MTTTNRLFYTVSKRYIQAGTTFKIDVKILLADDCKNNICDWSLKKLEELTRQTWENPYKPENERFTLKLTDEERTTITNRINDGYYRPEAVQARKDEEKRKAYEKKRAEIINNCEKKQEKAENEKRVMLAVLDAGLSVSNVIYYDHSNELVFNWRDHETKVTENDFNKFVSSVNRSLLPVGITFKMK